MSTKSKIDVAIAVAEGYLSTDNIIADGESRSCARAVAGLVEVVKLFADELNEFRHREVITSLIADAPEIVAAEARGKMDEANTILQTIREMVHDADEPGCHEIQPYRDGLIAALRAVDARVASLRAKRDTGHDA